MTITMYDADQNSQFPKGAAAYAAYVDGRIADQPNYGWIVANFPAAHHMSISVLDNSADCLDIENGAATVEDAPAWYAKQKALGATRPVFYCSASMMGSLLVQVHAIPRADYRLWSAHYGAGEHICGPHTCGEVSVDVDGTQWADHVGNLNADQSLLNDDFFGAVTPVSTVVYTPVSSKLPTLSAGMKDSDLPHWYVRRLQAILNYVYGYPVNLTGIYDPMTVAGVKLLQSRDGLTQDGVCGPQTWGRVVGG
jgi:hypothetical protein